MARDSRAVWWTKRFHQAIEFALLESVKGYADLLSGERKRSQMTVVEAAEKGLVVCDLFARSQCRYNEAFGLRLRFKKTPGSSERGAIMAADSPLNALLHGYDAGSQTNWLYPWILIDLNRLRAIFSGDEIRSTRTGQLWGESRSYDGWEMWIDLRALAKAHPPERELIIDASYLRDDPLPDRISGKIYRLWKKGITLR